MAESPTIDGTEHLLESVRATMAALHDQCGPLYLGALVKFANESPGIWTMLVGSSLLTRDIHRGMRKVTRVLGRTLAEPDSRRISRVGIVEKSDPFYLSLAQAFQVEPISFARLTNVTIDSYQIEEGALYVVVRPDSARIASKKVKIA